MKRAFANRVGLRLGILLLWNCVGASVASADEWTWVYPSFALNNNWSYANNWYSSEDSNAVYAPSNDGTADINFPAGSELYTTSNVDANWFIHSLYFVGSNAYVLAGSQLTIGAGGIVSNDTAGSGVNINTPILFASPQTWMATAQTTLTFGGSVNINSQKLTLDGGGNMNFNGAVTGTGQLILNGTGNVTFGGSTANTFSYPIQVNNGTLYLDKSSNPGAAVAGDLIIGDGASTGYALVQLENSNQISDSHTVTINSNGELYIPNGTQEYIPSLVLNGGFVFTGTAANCFLGFINNSGYITTNASSTLALISGVLYLNDDSSHTTTISVASGTTGSGIDFGIAALVVAGGITKTGPGTMLLTNSNTFAGGVNLNFGRILVGSDTVGSSGSITPGPLGTGTLTMSDQTALQASGDHTMANAINIPTAATSGIVDGPNNLTLTGTLTGNGGLVKNGAGTLTLNNVTNRILSGGLTINNGTFALSTGSPTNGMTIGGNLAVGAVSGQTATLNINNALFVQSGAGTTIVGSTGSGAATANIGSTANGGISVGSGGLTINPTGVVNIGSGTTSGTLNLTSGGNVVINGGKLEIDGGSVMVPLPFQTQGSVHLENGATLTTNASIALPITGDGTTSTINVNANIGLGNAVNSPIGFNFQGVLNLAGHTLTITSGTYAQLGALTNLSAGTIVAANGVSLGSGSYLAGPGTVSGQFVGHLGSQISVPVGQSLQLGDASSPAGFNFGGSLNVGLGNVTLNSSGPASLGNLTTLNSGTLTAANGFVENFGDAITGYGTIASSNTLALHSVINGIVQGNSSSQQITLSGWIKGTGTFNNVTFTGTYDPGFSPATVNVGNIAFSSGSTLNIDIGGTSPGSQYDQIISSGTPTLAGTLNLSPYGGFVPVAGDKFTVMTYSSVSGTFSTVTGTSAGPGLTYSAVYLPTSLVILTTVNGEKTWGVDASGNSSLGSNWIGGVAPGGIGDTATFSTIITAPRTVTVDADTTVGTLKFDSPNNYTIAGPHTLTLQAAGSSAAAINVSGVHGNGAHTISAPITLASDLSISQNSGGTLRLTGPLNDSASHAITKSGSGTAEIDGPPTLGSNSSLSVAAGTLRFGLTSGSATIGTGVVAMIGSGATLELAGSISALSSGANRANIVNNSSAPVGLLVSGTHQRVGNIDGSGTTQVNAGSDVTANHIIQSALLIGGAAGSPAIVTIDASDASGNPLLVSSAGAPSEQNSAGPIDSLIPSGPFAPGNASSPALITIAADSGNLTVPSIENPIEIGNSLPVPEPSTLLLALVAISGVVGARHRRCAS